MPDMLTKEPVSPEESLDYEKAVETLRGIYLGTIRTLSDAVVVDGTTPIKTQDLFPDLKVRLSAGSNFCVQPAKVITEFFESVLCLSLIAGLSALAVLFIFGFSFWAVAIIGGGAGAFYYMGTAGRSMKHQACQQLIENKDAVLALAPILDHPCVSAPQKAMRARKITAIHFKRGITVDEADLFNLGLFLISAYEQVFGDLVTTEFQKTFHSGDENEHQA